MSKGSVVHATFDMTRTYPAPRARVFAAFADAERKRAWSYGAAAGAHTLDFRPGGREHVEMPGPGGGTFTYDGIYQDIVENERIVCTYAFGYGSGLAGATLATFELADAPGGGTRLKLTEQGAYVDGFDGPKFWERGTSSLLDRLAEHLEGETK